MVLGVPILKHFRVHIRLYNLCYSSASLPDDDDPAAMMAYLKSTLAKMEEKLNM